MSLAFEWNKRRGARTLNIVPNTAQSFWAQSLPQSGGQPINTTIHIKLHVTNLLDEATRLLHARLLKPSIDPKNVRQTLVMVENPFGGNMYSPEYSVQPRSTQAVDVSILLNCPLGKLGHHINIKLAISDQFGCENVFNVALRDQNAHS